MSIVSITGASQATIQQPKAPDATAVFSSTLPTGTEATPAPDFSDVFGSITAVFNTIVQNPVLLIIAMVIIIFVIGKVF